MRRGRDLVGLPVITRDNGTKVGKVEDVILDRACTRVLGLLVDEGGWFSSARVVPWASILVVGLDAVIIAAEAGVKKASEVPEMNEVLDRGYVLDGLELETTRGTKLGRIEEFYFDPTTGVVRGFELSGGRKPSFLPLPQGFETGRDVAFVDPSVESTIIELREALRED
ncbi:MAG: PRC-barrel domain-containing protein [Actinobacteria bacterium]|nr:PRC-barrel domain-containing protein [Actinomycetota bacterium]